MGKIVDTESKYRPRSLDEFVFPNKNVKEVAKAYGSVEIHLFYDVVGEALIVGNE